MRENEIGFWMPDGELDQLECVRCFLSRIVPPAVLPDVVEYRHSTTRRHLADWIQQWIVRPAAGGELDADHASIEAPPELGLGVRTKVRVDHAVAANAIRMGVLKAQEAVVTVLDVSRRWKVDRRGESPASQNGSDVDRNPNPLARAQPAGISFLPVAARRTVV
jgi:hypothetical protein